MLNLTRVEEAFPNKYRLSPRKTFCGTKMGSDHTNLGFSGDSENVNDMSNWMGQFGNDGLPTRSAVYDSKI